MVLQQSFHRQKKKKHHEESTALVIPLLPPEAPLPDTEEEADLLAFHVVATAAAEAATFEDGSLVSVDEDPVLAKDVVHLDGKHGETNVPRLHISYL